MKKFIILLGIFIFSIIIFITYIKPKLNEISLNNYENNIVSKNLKLIPHIGRESSNVTVKDYDSYFRTAHRINSLIKHELFYNMKDTIQFYAYFDKDVTIPEIQSIRGFVTKKFIIKSYGKFNEPYNEWILENKFFQNIKPFTVICDIYVDNNLLFQDVHVDNDLDVYENTLLDVDSKKFSRSYIDTLNKYVKDKIPGAFLNVQKSIIGYPLIVRIQSSKMVDLNKIKDLEYYVQNELSKSIEKDTSTKDTKAVVLQFVVKNRSYYESSYLIYKDQWLKENWMNFDYFVKG